MAERDYGLEAHEAAEAHLDACHEAEYYAEEFGEENVESPAFGPFCGCTTCVVREVLEVAWPILMEAVRAEVAQ